MLNVKNLQKEPREATAIEEKQETATKLSTQLNEKRKTAWISTVEGIDMKSSSRKAWSTINKLTVRKNISPNPNTISPNVVASVLLKNGKFNNPDKNFARHVNHELKDAWNAPSICRPEPLQWLHNRRTYVCDQFTQTEELMSAISSLKSGKAPRPDNLYPEFFIHLDDSCIEWLRKLFSL